MESFQTLDLTSCLDLVVDLRCSNIQLTFSAYFFGEKPVICKHEIREQLLAKASWEFAHTTICVGLSKLVVPPKKRNFGGKGVILRRDTSFMETPGWLMPVAP